MENEKNKGNVNSKILLAVLLLFLCAGSVAGLLLYQKSQSVVVEDTNDDTTGKKETTKVESNIYTVVVKNSAGTVLPNVLVSFYDAEGNVITEPEATDNVGRLKYKPESEGTYGASVVAAPYQYTLSREISYFEEGEKTLNLFGRR